MILWPYPVPLRQLPITESTAYWRNLLYRFKLEVKRGVFCLLCLMELTLIYLRPEQSIRLVLRTRFQSLIGFELYHRL